MWWDDETIEQTVTKQFVCGRLVSQEIDRLDQPLGFGDNLTDCTYWEWIDEKAKKIFLVLNDLGLPGHIFELIDDSLDDEDLPIALEEVERLAVARPKTKKVLKKFYHHQFHYLLRRLDKGGHVDYHDDEVIPLDVAGRKHTASQPHHVDKVALPNQPGNTLCRCRIPLGPGHLSHGEFMSEIDGMKNMQNEHLLSYWASYTHRGYGYVLFTPAPEFSLKSLLTTTPSCVKRLDKKTRRQTVMDWIYCLVKMVNSLHGQGLSHGNIKPSTVMFSSDNRVVFSGITRFQTDILRGVTDNISIDNEAYDYAAPEKLFNPFSSSATSTHRPADHGTNPAATTHVSIPDLSQQAADIFSLGCIILELLAFLFKKHGRRFATYRAAKHRSARRRGGVPDSSFHKNLSQVESWMVQLVKDASKKDDTMSNSVAPMLYVVEQMLAYLPLKRPTANEVLARMNDILAESYRATEGNSIHRDSGCDVGMESFTLSSSPLASIGSIDYVSDQMSQQGGSQDKTRRRNDSGGSESLQSFNSSIHKAGREETISRTTSNISGSRREDKGKKRGAGCKDDGRYMVMF